LGQFLRRAMDGILALQKQSPLKKPKCS
jgi:hypothetical protein